MNNTQTLIIVNLFFFMFQLYASQDCVIFVEQYRTSQKEFSYSAPYGPCFIQDEAIIA